jgi:ribosomal protein S12 methylthiotransferase accessory factor
MRMQITFPGGAAVDAEFKGHVIHTDQPVTAGGDNTAPAPFDLFLASIGTCAGYYAMRFCQHRQIDLDGLRVSLEPLRDPERGRIGTIRIEVEVPPEFPEKYHDALVRSIDQCAVKKHIVEAPEFEVEVKAPEMVPMT